MKEANPNLVYVKFGFGGRNLKKVNFKDKKVQNIFDFYEIRKRLYKLKGNQISDFNMLVGQHFFEYNFGKEEDLNFHSNFESGNLQMVSKVLFPYIKIYGI